MLTWLERYLLKKIAKKLVVQGPLHQRRITEYYRIINQAACEEFREDNKATLDDLLQECHTDSLKGNCIWKQFYKEQ